MRIVGHRKERPITFHANSGLLESGVRFNDETHRAFGTKSNGVKRGIYRFKSHQAANNHQDACIAAKLAQAAKARECD